MAIHVPNAQPWGMRDKNGKLTDLLRTVVLMPLLANITRKVGPNLRADTDAIAHLDRCHLGTHAHRLAHDLMSYA